MKFQPLSTSKKLVLWFPTKDKPSRTSGNHAMFVLVSVLGTNLSSIPVWPSLYKPTSFMLHTELHFIIWCCAISQSLFLLSFRNRYSPLPLKIIVYIVICCQSCSVLEIIQVTFNWQQFTKDLLHVELISILDNPEY